MILMLFAAAIAALFFIGSLLLLHLGQQLGLRHRNRNGSEGIGGLATVEGAIFGLMGLLLAFTISGALQRFDDRRQLVIQEATAATTAYDRLSLFGGDDARRLQTGLKEYVRARIDLYRMAHDFLLLQQAEDFSDQQEKNVLELKNQLWDAAVAACPQPNYRPACALSLPALNSLFEVARLRAGAAEKHPPQIIYFMLFGLGLGCSLLAGFGMAASAGHSWIHMLLFAGTLTVALYIVTDMEYPRLGLIRIESFDHFLSDAHDQMR
jgi:low affinity Fe/Cu permease